LGIIHEKGGIHINRKTDFRLSRGLLIPNLRLATAEGIIFFVFLLLVQKDPKNNFIVGFSSKRLLLLAGIFAITVLFLTFFVYFQHNAIKASRIDTWLLSKVSRVPTLLTGYFFFWLTIYTWLAIYKPGVLHILEEPSYMVRLAPYWGLSLLIPLQLACFWFFEWKSGTFTLPFYLALVSFIGFLVLGLLVYQQYGLAWDEPLQVNIGQTNWAYIKNHNPKLLTFNDRYYGPAYELILLHLTYNTDTRQMYLERHLFNFLFFFAGVVAFYWLAQRLFSSSWMALLASVCLMLSPRIFADSFYNTKDVPFMVVYIFTMITLVLFLDRPTWITAVLHAGVSAFLIAIRVPGIFIPVITIVFLIAKWIFQPSPRKIVGRELLATSIYLILTLSLTILFWPILWHDPLGEFINSLNRMSQYPWIGNILYLGNLIKTDQLPWHYIPIWISISTPLLYLACFGLGVILMVAGLFRQSGNWFEGEKRNSLIILTFFFCPLLAVIILHSILYDAWRQMFFIYPAFLLAAVQGIRLVTRILRRWLQPIVLYSFVVISLAIGLLDPVAFMVRNHPYENIYFNRLAGVSMVQIKQRFDLDYWGLAFKQGIDYILATDPGNRIPIYVTDPPGEEYIDNFLPDNQRNRLIIEDSPDQARYFVGNYRYHPEEYSFNNKIYSVTVDGASILSVFDLNTEPDNQNK
jgi:hypothetical protein